MKSWTATWPPFGHLSRSMMPQSLIGLCEAAHVPAFWATQVLENLAKTG
ncbi:MAG: hypothetical protein ABIQ15_13145 [Nocardioides sp.]